MDRKKKKNVKKHQNDPAVSVGSSDDEQEMATLKCKSCSHVKNSVNIGQLRKSLKKNTDQNICQSCDKINQENTVTDCDDSTVDTVIWLCLQCGHRGCDRNSRNQHSLAHYQTPRSTSHAIVVNTSDWRVWCYECDDEVSSVCNRHLESCVEFLKRRQQDASVIKEESKDALVSVNEDVTSNHADISTDISHCQVVTEEKETNVAKPVKKSVPLPKVKGLRNFGNTCFFNAVVQALSHSQLLRDLLPKCLEERTVGLIPDNRCNNSNLSPLDLQVMPCANGSLTSALVGLVKDANCNDSRVILSPTSLYNSTCSTAPQFKGFQQHDSHELLRHLLDGVRAEEIREMQRGILKVFRLTTKTDPASVDKEVKGKVNSYGKLARHTIIDSIFSGQLVSTVMCEECQTPSQVFETFLDLSLPVTEDKPVRPGTQRKQADRAANAEMAPQISNEEGGFLHQDNKRARKKAARVAKVQSYRSQKSDSSEVTKRFNKYSHPVTDGIMELFDSPLVVESTNEYHVGSAASSSDKNQSDLNDADIEDNLESGSNSSSTNGAKVSAEDTTTGIVENDECCHQQTLQNNAMSCADTISHDSGIESPVINVSEPSINSPAEDLHAKMKDLSLDANHVEEIGEVAGKEEMKMEDKVDKDERCSRDEWMEFSRRTLAPRQHLAEHSCSILSCLAQFTSRELLTGNNKFGCDNCTKLKRKNQKGSKPEVVYSNASKQLLVLNPPAILTLHLKRFQQTLSGLRKVNRHVEFPQVLDLAPFCSAACLGLPSLPQKQTQVLYSLYGVVEHSGRLTGGHYTAFVKVRPKVTDAERFLNRSPVTVSQTEDLAVTMRRNCSDVFLGKEDIKQLANGPFKWYHVSDTHVAEVSENTVLKSQAYILFYERIF